MFRKKTPAPQGRQRPLAGSTQRNAAVFSYRSVSRPQEPVAPRSRSMKQADEQNVTGAATTRRKQQHSWLKRGPRLGVIILVALLLLGNLFLSTTPQIVTVTGGSVAQAYLRPQSVYAEATQQMLAGSIFNHAKPTINTTEISKKLQAEFPELAMIRVSVPAVGTQPKVYVEPATPVLMLSAAGKVYALDSAGKVLILTSQVPSLAKLHLPLVEDQSGIPITIGKIALPGSTTAFITEVVAQLKAKKVTVNSMVLPKATSELDVKIEGLPYWIKFNVRGNSRVEAGTYLAVKQQLERGGITPPNYIDVRVEGHAYYK